MSDLVERTNVTGRDSTPRGGVPMSDLAERTNVTGRDTLRGVSR
jgi:hypothetical protein